VSTSLNDLFFFFFFFLKAAATRSLARGTNFNAIISMLKEVGPLCNAMPSFCRLQYSEAF